MNTRAPVTTEIEHQAPPPENKKFSAKQLALTYPQCPLDKGTAAAQLKVALEGKGVTQLVVAQEHHEDGNLHLHAYVSMADRYIARGKHQSLILTGTDLNSDQILNYYPNVQAVKNKLNWLKYLVKEDKSPYEYGIITQQVIEATVNKTKILGKRLL